MSVAIPKRIAEELEKSGVDVGSLIVDLLVKFLNLDPHVAAESHLELALKYLEEGERLIDEYPPQASEKLYKAAEEAVKALAMYLNLREVLEDVEKSGRWSVGRLEKAVVKISEKVGGHFRSSWDAAWALHVWGFHEAKFDSEDVRVRVPDIEKIVLEAQKLIKREKSEREER
jgi:hypothetical protein